MRIVTLIVLAGCVVRTPLTRHELEQQRDRARMERKLGIGGIVAGLVMVAAGVAFAMSADDARQRPDGEDGDGLPQLAGAFVFLGLGTTFTVGGAVVTITSSVELDRAERALEASDRPRPPPP
jgi:hypothetical protein